MAIEQIPRPKEYITITEGLRGFFAVHAVLVTDEFGTYYDAEQTHPSSYKTEAEAIPDAVAWAKDNNIEFRLQGYDGQGNPTN